jgi:hypothetical protein
VQWCSGVADAHHRLQHQVAGLSFPTLRASKLIRGDLCSADFPRGAVCTRRRIRDVWEKMGKNVAQMRLLRAFLGRPGDQTLGTA